MKVRIKFRKNGCMKFIGHLDVMRYFQKALRRAEIPVKLSGGYSPHMIMSFANPLGVGLTSDGEYFDVELTEPVRTADALARLNAVMTEGMEVTAFLEIPDDKKNKGMTLVAGAAYRSEPWHAALPDGWERKLEEFYAQEEILVEKQTKKSTREINIRPLIHELYEKDRAVYMTVSAGSAENLKPELVMGAFLTYLGIQEEEPAFSFRHHRLETYADADALSERGAASEIVCGRYVPLEALGWEIA